MKKIALVTGANRGIGLQIVRDLAALEDVQVVATSRNEEKGRAALLVLGDKVDYHSLDVTDEKSIEVCCKYIEETYGRCDILVNNAGIFPDAASAGGGGWPGVLDTSIETMRRGMETNVYGPMLLCQKIIPLMQKNGYGRIVNLSSGMGQLAHMNSGCPAYRLSKTALNALTKTLAEELNGTNILANCMCPGWVKTDMGGPGATRELPEVADTAIFLATLPDQGPTGGFFRDRKIFEW